MGIGQLAKPSIVHIIIIGKKIEIKAEAQYIQKNIMQNQSSYAYSTKVDF